MTISNNTFERTPQISAACADIPQKLWSVDDSKFYGSAILKLESHLRLHVGPHRTCSRDGPKGSELIIFGRQLRD
jgi:hypothetical protein